MSVNLSLGINPKKTAHLGPIFHTIDFDCETKELSIGNQKLRIKMDLVQDLIYQFNERWLKNETVVDINGHIVTVTKHEIARLIETFENVKRTNYQRYRFFGK